MNNLRIWYALDTNGNAVEQYVESGDDPSLRESYGCGKSCITMVKNPTDDIQPVTVPV